LFLLYGKTPGTPAFNQLDAVGSGNNRLFPQEEEKQA
jgi:hypothetical protein